MILTPADERLTKELSLPVFKDLDLSQPEIDSRSPACEAYSLTLRHRGYTLNGKVQKDLIQNDCIPKI